jgi:hypothetical protein
VRQWRGANGPVHCSTPYPRAANDVLYGRFVEVTRVSHATVGYKSAHMLWPSQSPRRWEIGWPENNWAGIGATPHGFDHFDKTTNAQRLAWVTMRSLATLVSGRAVTHARNGGSAHFLRTLMRCENGQV